MTSLPVAPVSPSGPDTVAVLRRYDHGGRSSPVTVIVSLYNYGQFVTACLDSVRDQTLAGLDLVVVDDCSTDRSAEVVASWLDDHAARFHHCQLRRHGTNRGLAETRNTAFSLAATPYVFVLDADNMLYPRCLECLQAALEHCGASFAYCYAEKFGDVCELANLHPWNPSRFSVNNTIDAMALIRKAVWEEVGGYSRDMPAMGWEDFDLWFKIARRKGWGVLVPEVLARYRVHGASMLRRVTNPKVDSLWVYLRKSYPEFFPASSD